MLIFQKGESEEWSTDIERLVYTTFATMKVDSLEWTQQVAKFLLDQVSFYEDNALERGFLLNIIGIAVHHGAVQQGSSYGMDFVMTSVRHHLLEESRGCAAALGTPLSINRIRWENQFISSLGLFALVFSIIFCWLISAWFSSNR